jgi:predicted nucleotidyltransferase
MYGATGSTSVSLRAAAARMRSREVTAAILSRGQAAGHAPGAPGRAIAAGIRLFYNESVAIDLDQVRMFLARKEESRRRRLDERFVAASGDFERIVRRLVDAYNPRRIYQWGSLIERDHFSEISDIDIAVEGLRGPEEYYAALGDAIRMTDFPVDLIELEKVPAATADHIRRAGRMIHERPEDP